MKDLMYLWTEKLMHRVIDRWTDERCEKGKEIDGYAVKGWVNEKSDGWLENECTMINGSMDRWKRDGQIDGWANR